MSSVSLDLVADDSNDPGFLKAYNSAGVLLQDLETGAPTYPSPGYLTMTITRPAADIAYVLAGGQVGQAVYFDHLVVNGSTGGSDYYKISANAGDPMVISTATPGDGPGEFANILSPHIDLYDPSERGWSPAELSVPMFAMKASTTLQRLQACIVSEYNPIPVPKANIY